MDIVHEILDLAIAGKYDVLEELVTLIKFLQQGGLQ